MRPHATRKIHASSALDREPSTCALDSSRSLSFIPPLRPRWSPVVLQRKTPSISFPFTSLRNSFLHNEGGTPTPSVFLSSRHSFTPSAFSERPLSLLFATDPKNAPVTPLLATHPKTQVLKVLCLPHFQKLTGVGAILLTRFLMLLRGDHASDSLCDHLLWHSSVLSLRGSAEKNTHNSTTEILAILFPPPKHPLDRGIMREHKGSYTLKTMKCLVFQNCIERGDLR
jgi:hypothetical protein